MIYDDIYFVHIFDIVGFPDSVILWIVSWKALDWHKNGHVQPVVRSCVTRLPWHRWLISSSPPMFSAHGGRLHSWSRHECQGCPWFLLSKVWWNCQIPMNVRKFATWDDEDHSSIRVFGSLLTWALLMFRYLLRGLRCEEPSSCSNEADRPCSEWWVWLTDRGLGILHHWLHLQHVFSWIGWSFQKNNITW